MSTPEACANQELRSTKNAVIKPQRIICTVGQYISSNTRGHEPRNKYRCRSTNAPMRRSELETTGMRKIEDIFKNSRPPPPPPPPAGGGGWGGGNTWRHGR